LKYMGKKTWVKKTGRVFRNEGRQEVWGCR
jgi:hypothetical protein